MDPESTGLAQLASVYEKAANLEPGDAELVGLFRKVLEERMSMEKQLTRRRVFEDRVNRTKDSNGQVRDKRFEIQTQSEETKSRIAHLQDQIEFIKEAKAHAQAHIDTVKAKAKMSVSTTGEHTRATIRKMQEEKKQAGEEQASLKTRRDHLETIFNHRQELQEQQERMAERQRQAGQDRSLLLHAIDAIQDELARTREERLQLSEQRLAMQHEMDDITLQNMQAEDMWAQSPQAPSTGASTPASLPRVKGYDY